MNECMCDDVSVGPRFQNVLPNRCEM